MRSRSTSFCKVYLWAYDMLRPCPVRGAATLSRQPRNRPVGARASAELVAVPRAPGVEDGVWRQADATLVTDFAINVQLLFLFCFVKSSVLQKSALFDADGAFDCRARCVQRKLTRRVRKPHW